MHKPKPKLMVHTDISAVFQDFPLDAENTKFLGFLNSINAFTITLQVQYLHIYYFCNTVSNT